MSESAAHFCLVKYLANWVIHKHLDGDSSHIFIDSPESVNFNKTFKINGFVPDVYVSDSNKHIFVIGEAKTEEDFSTSHSRDQLKAFLEECSRHDGAVFVLAVPWYVSRFARQTVNLLIKEMAIKRLNVEILDKLPG